MESKDIYNIIEKTFNDGTYKKVFINGPWGIGKSYYANKYYEDHKTENILYISLFGKSTTNDIEDEINKQVIKKSSGINSWLKKGKFFLKKHNIQFSYYVSMDISSFGKKFLLEDYAQENKDKNILIIVDDVERKSNKVSIVDIMGIIESISLIENIKIILIGDEIHINNEEINNWNNFKEKIIEKEYKIDVFSKEAIDSLIINKTNKYISKNELEKFINDFFQKHKVKNLRTINKGVNLFNEIIENYTKDKNNKKNNLIILKNCLAVTIEYTEELYKPKAVDKNSKDTLTNIMNEMNADINSRILSHYFKALFSKEESILNYIIQFYQNKVTPNIISNFNIALETMQKEIKNEEKLFYLAEENIRKKLDNLSNNIKKQKYVFTTIDKLISDAYDIFDWNDALKMNYNKEELFSAIHTILLNNYYDVKKEEYENKIDSFYIIRSYQNNDVKKIITDYNSTIESKYLDDKLSMVLESYKMKTFDFNCLEYFKGKLNYPSDDYCKKKFGELCKKNNYLLPDLSKKINDYMWMWTHYIWDIYRQYMDKDSKNELNEFVNSKISGSTNLLEKHRLRTLQKIKPLI